MGEDPRFGGVARLGRALGAASWSKVCWISVHFGGLPMFLRCSKGLRVNFLVGRESRKR